VFRLALGPTQPSIQLVVGALPQEVKWPGHEADLQPVSSAEVKNDPSCTFIPPCTFTSCMFAFALCTGLYIITSQKAVVFIVTAMGTLVITLHLILQHQSLKKIVLTSGCLYYSANFFTNAFVFVKEKGNGHPITYHRRHRWGLDGQLRIFLTFSRVRYGQHCSGSCTSTISNFVCNTA